jgi:hypothetical protein
MRQGLDGVDHLMITTPDLDSARRRMERLGFSPTPRGFHSLLGTMNHTAMFRGGNYIELLGIDHPTPHNEAYRASIARDGESVSFLALKTHSAEQLYEELRDTRFKAVSPIDFARDVSTPEGLRQARFTIVQLDNCILPATSAFACQHHTPEFVWQSNSLDHPNGALSIKYVSWVVSNAAEAADVYGELFQLAPTYSNSRAQLDLGDVCLEFAQWEDLRTKSAMDVHRTQAPPAIVSIGVAVTDLSAVAEILEKNGVAFGRGTTGTIVVPVDHAFGCAIEFVASDNIA